MIGVALFIIAFAFRAYINRGATKATPDEKVYSLYASKWRPGASYTESIRVFVTQPHLEVPPTRFAFFALSALVTWGKKHWVECFNPLTWVAVTCGALAAPLALLLTGDWRSSFLLASAPLSLMLSRRALQDAFAALTVLGPLFAIQNENPWALGAALALMLATREALILFLPAFWLAWWLKTSDWLTGGLAVGGGGLLALMAFYAVGGRQIVAVFRKLGQPTDYVARFQSGMAHRVLVDLMLVSPVSLVAGCIACAWAPLWLIGFLGMALLVHANVGVKNVRFLLAVDLGVRLLSAWLPEPWPWVALALGAQADLRLYLKVGGCKDPVTYNLLVRTGMYTEPK